MADYKEKEQEMIDIFTTIFDSIIKGERQKYDKIAEFLQELYADSKDLYSSELALFYSNLSECACKPFRDEGLKTTDRKKLAVIPYLYNGVFEHFVRTTIDNREGRICAGDKTSFVIESIKKALKDDENYSLHRVYSKKDEFAKPEDYGKLAYWSPTSFSDTNDVFDKFYEWYFDIGKSRYDEYLDDGK